MSKRQDEDRERLADWKHNCGDLVARARRVAEKPLKVGGGLLTLLERVGLVPSAPRVGGGDHGERERAVRERAAVKAELEVGRGELLDGLSRLADLEQAIDRVRPTMARLSLEPDDIAVLADLLENAGRWSRHFAHLAQLRAAHEAALVDPGVIKAKRREIVKRRKAEALAAAEADAEAATAKLAAARKAAAEIAEDEGDTPAPFAADEQVGGGGGVTFKAPDRLPPVEAEGLWSSHNAAAAARVASGLPAVEPPTPPYPEARPTGEGTLADDDVGIVLGHLAETPGEDE